MHIKICFVLHREHTAFHLRRPASLILLQGDTEQKNAVLRHNALLFRYTAGGVDISHKDLQG